MTYFHYRTDILPNILQYLDIISYVILKKTCKEFSKNIKFSDFDIVRKYKEYDDDICLSKIMQNSYINISKLREMKICINELIIDDKIEHNKFINSLKLLSFIKYTQDKINIDLNFMNYTCLHINIIKYLCAKYKYTFNKSYITDIFLFISITLPYKYYEYSICIDIYDLLEIIFHIKLKRRNNIKKSFTEMKIRNTTPQIIINSLKFIIKFYEKINEKKTMKIVILGILYKIYIKINNFDIENENDKLFIKDIKSKAISFINLIKNINKKNVPKVIKNMVIKEISRSI